MPSDSSQVSPAHFPMTRSRRSDAIFFLILGGLSACFIMLIVLLLIADIRFTSMRDFTTTLSKPEIRAAIWLTLTTCTMAAFLSILVGVPLGYLLARYQFFGKWIIDTMVDIPIVLPPLVLGLSLLILFHQPFFGLHIDQYFRETLKFPIAFAWPAVVLAQFSVSCAFAVRTMRITFEQMNPRAESVARTLGCTRNQAFWYIALPQANRGMITAFTIAWARALGEFGPIMVFAGTTRMRTEVLSTTVFLELSVGSLNNAVAVSLLMVAMAIIVLLVLRVFGARLAA